MCLNMTSLSLGARVCDSVNVSGSGFWFGQIVSYQWFAVNIIFITPTEFLNSFCLFIPTEFILTAVSSRIACGKTVNKSQGISASASNESENLWMIRHSHDALYMDFGGAIYVS